MASGHHIGQLRILHISSLNPQDGIGSTGNRPWFPVPPSLGPKLRPSLGSPHSLSLDPGLVAGADLETETLGLIRSSDKLQVKGHFLKGTDSDVRLDVTSLFYASRAPFSEYSSHLLKLFKFYWPPKTEGL